MMTLTLAREIAVRLRCDPRSVMRAWHKPGSVRGVLGEALEVELAPLRAARTPAGGPHEEARDHERSRSA